MSKLISILLAINGSASAGTQISQLPLECNVYGNLFCLPVIEKVHLHTYSPSEDFVLHKITSASYSMLVYEGNAPQSLKNGPEWQKISVGRYEYDYLFYKNGDEVQLYFDFNKNNWPKALHVTCKNLKKYGCKHQLLLMKHCSRIKDDTKCNDNYSKILRKRDW